MRQKVAFELSEEFMALTHFDTLWAEYNAKCAELAAAKEQIASLTAELEHREDPQTSETEFAGWVQEQFDLRDQYKQERDAAIARAEALAAAIDKYLAPCRVFSNEMLALESAVKAYRKDSQ
jgi:hypothetical protein